MENDHISLKSAYVSSREQLSQSSVLLTISLDGESNVRYKPGQSVGLINQNNSHTPLRYYSIIDADKKNSFSILVKEVENGYLSPVLVKMNKNHPVYIGDIRGSFLFRGSPSVFICTGTGVAPFYCYYQHFEKQLENCILIQGSRTEDELYFHEQWSGSRLMKYIPLVSRDEFTARQKKRVDSYLMSSDNYFSGIIKQLIQEKYDFYLCGRAEMVVSVRDILLDKGVAFNRIFSEIYF